MVRIAGALLMALAPPSPDGQEVLYRS